jgi:soluble cytochrome b562
MTRVALILLCACVVGCGGDDRLTKDAYAELVRDEYAEVQEAFRATGASYGQPDLAEKIEAAQDELRETADTLEDAEPPEDAEAENEQIVDGMRRYAESLDRLRNAAERGDLRAIEDASARITTNQGVLLIAEAAEKLKFKGYDLGQIAEE